MDWLAIFDSDDAQMDKVLDALYDSDRSAGLGSSCPNVNRWLGDIRTYCRASRAHPTYSPS